MKAVILVGGEATRLRPLTCNIPKAMVPVLNRPFLEHVLCHLSSSGVDMVILAQARHNRAISDYFGDGGRVGLKLVYSVEEQPMGTAGPVKLAERYLEGEDRFLVLNGDIFCRFDIPALLAFHRGAKAKTTLALIQVEKPEAYGVVETDERGRVKGFQEKPKPGEARSNMINAGMYVIERDVLARIPPHTKVMFEHDVFPGLLKDETALYGYAIAAYWIDIGTPEKYLQLNLDLLRQRESSAESYLEMGKGAKVHPSARIQGPAILGAGCEAGPEAMVMGPVVLGENCILSSRAIVQEAVLWRGAQVGEDARVTRSVLGSGTRIGRGAYIAERCAIGDNVIVGEGRGLEPGTRLWPDTRCED